MLYNHNAEIIIDYNMVKSQNKRMLTRILPFRPFLARRIRNLPDEICVAILDRDIRNMQYIINPSTGIIRHYRSLFEDHIDQQVQKMLEDYVNTNH
jgi:hypothetical protein